MLLKTAERCSFQPSYLIVPSNVQIEMLGCVREYGLFHMCGRVKRGKGNAARKNIDTHAMGTLIS